MSVVTEVHQCMLSFLICLKERKTGLNYEYFWHVCRDISPLLGRIICLEDSGPNLTASWKQKKPDKLAKQKSGETNLSRLSLCWFIAYFIVEAYKIQAGLGIFKHVNKVSCNIQSQQIHMLYLVLYNYLL